MYFTFYCEDLEIVIGVTEFRIPCGTFDPIPNLYKLVMAALQTVPSRAPFYRLVRVYTIGLYNRLNYRKKLCVCEPRTFNVGGPQSPLNLARFLSLTFTYFL